MVTLPSPSYRVAFFGTVFNVLQRHKSSLFRGQPPGVENLNSLSSHFCFISLLKH